ncbi:MAG: methionine--tRNA ligase, partial [Pseudomonadota bacterium]
ACADEINQYIDKEKPWLKAKDETAPAEVQAVCSMGLNGFRQLIIYLKPILPEIAKAAATFLNIDALGWNDVKSPLLNHTINPFKPLLKRIEAQQIENLKHDAKITH